MAVDPDPHGSVFIFPPGSGSRREKLKITEKCIEMDFFLIFNDVKSSKAGSVSGSGSIAKKNADPQP